MGDGVFAYIMKHKHFLKNVAIISLGGLFAKVIGAVYRIPLTALLGGYGMGLYQMAYPLFCLLLTFSSTGIPSALARLIAKERAASGINQSTVIAALRLFSLLGLCGTALMFLLAPVMSALQGEQGLLPCYRMLAPSVFLVALIAVFRGYFQGVNDMLPTAASEIVEQLFKAGAGLFFSYRFAQDPVKAVSYALFSVTLSEFVALGYLVLRFRGEKFRKSLCVKRTTGSDILFAALPVMTAAGLLPLSHIADSVLVVRLLSGYTEQAVSLYGLFAGGAVSLVSLPATACCGLATASVPSVSAYFARGMEEEGRCRALYALALTLALSLPCAVGLFVFAKPIVALLYSSLSPTDAKTMISLVRIMSVSAVSLAGVDTLAACLTGMGRAKQAAFSMLIAVLVKFILQYFLVRNPSLSVGGAAIAANACYLVAFYLDLFYTIKKKRVKSYDNDHWIGNGNARSDHAGDRRAQTGEQSACKERVACFGRTQRPRSSV